MEKKRVSYLDLAKGFGIILVVLGHIEYISTELRGWISSFHIPLFFVISGMLIAMKNEAAFPMKELTKKKLRGIIVPYYWFALIYFPIDIFNIVRENIDMHTFWQDQIYSINGYGISVMWFLPALFIGEITALLLIKFVDAGFGSKPDFEKEKDAPATTTGNAERHRNLIKYVVTFAAALLVSVVLYYVFQPVDRVFLANEQNYVYAAVFGFFKVIFRGAILSVFIVFGYVFQNILTLIDEYKDVKLVQQAVKEISGKNEKEAAGAKNKGVKNIDLKNKSSFDALALTTGIVLFILNMFTSLYNGSIDTHFLILKNLPMFYLCACIGSVAIILISRGIGSIKFIEYFGRNSLIIMATHIQFFILYISLLVAFKIDQYTTFAKHHIFIFCTTACVMMLEVPVIEVINRLFPFILGKKRHLEKEP